jgi:hypothetical protein
MDLGEEASVNHFSDSQIRDLFKLDTETVCQTHDLLDCNCCVSDNCNMATLTCTISNRKTNRRQKSILNQ